MARKAKPRPKARPKGEDEEFLRLEYDLNTLPTPQHRAGLAGLVLQIKAMDPTKAPMIAGVGPYAVTITFSKQSMVDLFDDLYDAAKVEAEFAKPRKERVKKANPLIRTIERTVRVKGKKKHVTRYIYEVIEPRCSLVARRVSKSNPLLQLLRDQIKLVIRTVAKAREVYTLRAETGSSGVGATLWGQIAKSKVETISGSHRLGVEARTAEGSAFQEDARLLLLLHFWQVVSLPYVPYTFKIEEKQLKYQYKGIATAVPEVAELDAFCDIFPRLLDDLGSDETLSGYRPRNMVIDCPEQAGLDMFSRLCALPAEQASTTEIGACVSGIEVWWTEKIAKSVRIHLVRRIDGRPELARKYDLIRKNSRNRFFSAIAMTALVKGTTIGAEAGRFYRTLPHDVMLDRWFGFDARRHIDGIRRQNKELGEKHMTISETDRLTEIVHRMITQYLRQKVKSKTGSDPFDERFKKQVDGRPRRILKKDVLEAWVAVCQRTHLDVRSRNANDFLAYFTGQICSDSQQLSSEERTVLTRHLFTGDWETVKNMVHLSLSALCGRFGSG